MRGIVEDEDAASGAADKLDGLNGFDHRCESSSLRAVEPRVSVGL